MLYHAKSGTVSLGDGAMEYIRFGSGAKHLVMLPGLGTSLRSLRGTALPMALLYRIFAKDFTVWVFNRKTPMLGGYTTRDMARDQAVAMERLGIEGADVFGVSMGGMIAQWLAADHPEKVDRLVLAVTCARPNPILRETMGEWVACAQRGDHGAFMERNLRRIYSEDYYRRNKWLTPILGVLTKPRSYAPFITQANACLTHECYAALSGIRAETLVLGGERDQCLGGEASREIAAAIPNAELIVYPQWGHGLYEEEKTFNKTVLDFLRGRKGGIHEEN